MKSELPKQVRPENTQSPKNLQPKRKGRKIEPGARPKDKTRTIGCWMPRELSDAAHAAARQLGMTFSEFMVRAMIDNLPAGLRRQARLAAGLDALATRPTLTNGRAA